MRRRRKYAKRRRRLLLCIALCMTVVCLILILAAISHSGNHQVKHEAVEIENSALVLPEKPGIVATASIGCTGDILIHEPIYRSCFTGYGYDFNHIFSLVDDYYQRPDVMICNLEVPLAGEEYGYSSFPVFNCPDEIAEALKNAGVDICLTANNHIYDMGYDGMIRTMEVLEDNGLEYIGTRKREEDSFLITRNINGIRVGMLCVTYDTDIYTDGVPSLNFNRMTEEGARCVNHFGYDDLQSFYNEIQQQMDYMNMLDVDISILFMHWGYEYQESPDETTQEQIAQKLCEMGIDVIIGGHPHVIQRFDVLENRNGHKTLCLYSTGNELSNQRAELIDEEPRGYTEDGLIFQIDIEKFNNGRAKVTNIEVIPTWVQRIVAENDLDYQIIPLDPSAEAYEWQTVDYYAAVSSYNRTMERLGADYSEFRRKMKNLETVQYLQ